MVRHCEKNQITGSFSDWCCGQKKISKKSSMLRVKESGVGWREILFRIKLSITKTQRSARQSETPILVASKGQILGFDNLLKTGITGPEVGISQNAFVIRQSSNICSQMSNTCSQMSNTCSQMSNTCSEIEQR